MVKVEKVAAEVTETQAPTDGPQYMLEVDHYMEGDRYVVAGTVIGAGTAYPFLHPDGSPRKPSMGMKPLNEAAEEMCAKRTGSRHPVDMLPIVR